MSKNYIDMNKTKIAGAIAASAVLALALFFVALPGTAYAEDWSVDGDFGSAGTCDGCGFDDSGWSVSGDLGSVGTCCDISDYSTPTNYSYMPSSGYSSPPYFGGGMGGFTGGWSFGGSGGGFGGSSSANSSVYAPTNTNTCTAFNSCNTTYDDHSIFNAPTNIVTNYPPAQNVVYSQPSYPVYTQPAPVYTPPVYVPAQRPIAYNNAPYVTLAAVPYTGLELGFWGTIAYWGFLVLWCLIAAYLIVVKKIQNKIAAWFTGNSQNISSQKVLGSPSGSAQPDHFAQKYSSPKTVFAGIASFVLPQINRAK